MSPGRIALEDFDRPVPCTPAECPEAASRPPASAETPCIAATAEPDHQAERDADLSRIASALETMACEQAALRARCVHDASEALGAAAASLVPAMARTGFAALVAEAARSIAECGQWPELAVSLAPGNAGEISDYLNAASSKGPGALSAIRIDPRDDMSAGEAALQWDSGGAQIDVDAITDAVLAEYRRKLDLLAQSGT